MKRVVLTILLLLTACAAAPPSDFQFQYGFGSCDKSSWIELTLDSNGIVRVGEHTLKLTNAQLNELVSAIEEQGFFSLKSMYSNPHVTGGMCRGMFVRMNGQEKLVEIANQPVPEVARIANVLTKFLDQKNPEWYK